LNLFRDFPSLVGLMPPEELWNETSAIISIQNSTESWTPQEGLELLKATHANISYDIRWNNYMDYNSVPPPGVTMYCLYGWGIPTIYEYIFSANFSKLVNYTYQDGDQDIPWISLDWCNHWKNNQPQDVFVFPLYNVSHNGIINSTLAWAILDKIF